MIANRSIPEFNKGFLVVIGLLLAATVFSASGCFDPEERGAEELVCDDDGCRLCEGTICRPYFCSTDSQCPHPYSCTAQGLCSLQPDLAQQTPKKQTPNDDGKDDPRRERANELDPECLDATDCDDTHDCIDGACVLVEPPPKDASALCIFAEDCGPQGLCIDGACFGACGPVGECPVTQGCTQGYCLPVDGGAGECLFGTDCHGDAVCINATCRPVCDADGECAAAEVCSLGLCAPDTTPKAQCLSNADCEDSTGCMEGRCLSACTEDADCGAPGSCFYGFCQPSFECRETLDCDADLECINGACMVF